MSDTTTEALITAAERYLQFNSKLKLRPHQVREWLELTKDLTAFYFSDEGYASLILLAAADKFIHLVAGETKAEMGMFSMLHSSDDLDNPFMLDETKQGGTARALYGWGCYGPMRLVNVPLPIAMPPEQIHASELAMALLAHNISAEETFASLRSELLKIAVEAPTPAEL